MEFSVELKELAYEIVKKSERPWFSSSDIKENLKQEGFIITDTIENEESNLVFTKDKKIKLISINQNDNDKRRKKSMLLYYGYYMLSPVDGYGFIKKYQDDIKGNIKTQAKKLGYLLGEYSVEKEFSPELFRDKEKMMIIRR